MRTSFYEGVTYPTVRIGDRVWMASNLRYEPAGLTPDTDFWTPQEGFDTDPELGLLYSYVTAMNGASGDGGRVQGICPDGWHIPDTAELQALAESAERPGDFLKCAGYWIVTDMNQRYGDSATGYLMGSECPESEKCRLPGLYLRFRALPDEHLRQLRHFAPLRAGLIRAGRYRTGTGV